MGLFGLFGFHREVLFRSKAHVLEHQDIARLCCMHGFLRMPPENAVNVHDRCAKQLFKFFGMGLQGSEILLSRPALVGDDDEARVGKGTYCRQVFAEPFIVQNKVGGGIDGGV